MIVIKGRCLGVEHKSREAGIDPRTGEHRDGYNYFVAHILDGWETRQCRIGDDYGVHPVEGEEIEATVRLRPYKRGTEAMLALTLEQNVKGETAGGRGQRAAE